MFVIRAYNRKREFVASIFSFCLCGLLLTCGNSKPVPQGQSTIEDRTVKNEAKKLKIFKDYAFYQQRSEPEEVIIGTLQKIEVRLGPNTRDMPFLLASPVLSLRIYVTNQETAILSQFVNRKIKATGKRIDQSDEGFGWEFWISSFEVLSEDLEQKQGK